MRQSWRAQRHRLQRAYAQQREPRISCIAQMCLHRAYLHISRSGHRCNVAHRVQVIARLKHRPKNSTYKQSEGQLGNCLHIACESRACCGHRVQRWTRSKHRLLKQLGLSLPCAPKAANLPEAQSSSNRAASALLFQRGWRRLFESSPSWCRSVGS